MNVLLDSPLTVLPGVGPSRVKAYQKLGIYTIFDLLQHFPRSYEDWSNPRPVMEVDVGEQACVEATVCTPVIERRLPGKRMLYRSAAFDESGRLELTFFNQPYLKNTLKEGETYRFFGRMEGNLLTRSMVCPAMMPLKDGALLSGAIRPCYGLSAGLSQGMVRANVRHALEHCAVLPQDTLPCGLREQMNLTSYEQALRTIHQPSSFGELELAKQRLSFDELFLLQLGFGLLRGSRKRSGAVPLRCDAAELERFLATFSFPLTAAQRRSIAEVERDMQNEAPMNRIVQGDVGSGKTVVAAAALYLCAKAGAQGALMAPTEVLAAQHYRNLAPRFERLGVRCALLVGGTPTAQKNSIKQQLKTGEIAVVIGTHALLEQDVVFQNLALCVTDEQHRFGVRHRATLADKGRSAHVLVMSATPIPRSLGLTLYGDLDLSVLDELPAGRKPIRTVLVDQRYEQRLLAYYQKQAKEGHQCFVVCPLVELSEGLSAQDATEYHQKLKEQVPQLRVGLVHGRMKAAQKQEVMESFAAGKLDVLVATTVVEVGVDVPNATVMVIENAERFGLSQLHQLRGRVGRGEAESICVLVSSSHSPQTLQRLQTMCQTQDGFVIAQKDFELRGPGEWFGDRQHGLMRFRIADLFSDIATLYRAKTAADELLLTDPLLKLPQHRALRDLLSTTFFAGSNQNIFN